MLAAGKLFGKIASGALARYGFAYADLLANWPQIIGPDIAALCQPERINWPQKAPAAKGRAKSQRLAGTLVLRTEPGRALELQYSTPQIIERINRYFGYEAIIAVKFLQGPIARKPAKPKPAPRSLAPETRTRLRRELDSIGDENLKRALMRLATGALGEKQP